MMDILNFLNEFELKYSLIYNIGFGFFYDDLIISLDLSNYTQATYDETQPSHTVGTLIFSGIKEFELDPKHMRADVYEILNVTYERVSGKLDKISIAFTKPIETPCSPESMQTCPYGVLSFRAQNVKWEPICSYFE